MNCHRVQNLLSAYLDQELSAEERRLVRQHLFSCQVCSKLYDELYMVKRSLGSLETPGMSEDHLQRLERMLSYYPSLTSDFLNHSFFWGKRLLLTAGCILLFLLTSLWLFPSEPSNPNLAADSRPASSGENRQPGKLPPSASKVYDLFIIPVSR